MTALPYTYDDGGREAAGFRGKAGDCVARAVAIASGRPYREVYDRLAEGNASQRRSRHDTGARTRTARSGISTRRKWFRDYMAELGFEWTPTMSIGKGCAVHLRAGELPTTGRHIVMVSKHAVALVDGVLRDTDDPQRELHTVYTVTADTEPKAGWRFLQDHPGGMKQYAHASHRCVYGYWTYMGARA